MILCLSPASLAFPFKVVLGSSISRLLRLATGCLVGSQSSIQARFDGTCIIGNYVWINPESYFDARHLIIEDYVGWGLRAKVLGSTDSSFPVDIPIVQNDLEIKPVRIDARADVGTNAFILPGVTIERGSIGGVGSVATKDVDSFSIVLESPAKFLKWPEGYIAEEDYENNE